MQSANNFNVAVRVRPPLDQEVGGSGEFRGCVAVGGHAGGRGAATISCSGNEQALLIGAEHQGSIGGADVHRLSFDQIFDRNTTQAELYAGAVSPAVLSSIQGYNATVFAYGQTGSGKTHTMLGSQAKGAAGLDELSGVIPRALTEVFQYVDAARAGAAAAGGAGGAAVAGVNNGDTIAVFVSFLQIYKENITDLLPGCTATTATPATTASSKQQQQQQQQAKLKLREESETGEVYAEGLNRIAVATPAEGLALLAQGSRARVTSQAWHAESSRSHAVFTVYVESRQSRARTPRRHKRSLKKSTGGGGGGGGGGGSEVDPDSTAEMVTTTRLSKLHLVDLAGSERVSQSGVTGDGLKEACAINQSLTTLAHVVDALIASQKPLAGGGGLPDKHVPYRNSKLTFFLRDSLGGNCRTTLIAAVSPSYDSFRETLSTLKFARCCTTVKNTVHVNTSVQRQRLSAAEAAAANQRQQVAKKPKRSNAASAFDAVVKGVQLSSTTTTVPTCAGQIQMTVVTSSAAGSKGVTVSGRVAVLLHSSGISPPADTSTFWLYLHAPLIAAGFDAVLIPAFPKMDTKAQALLQDKGGVACLSDALQWYQQQQQACGSAGGLSSLSLTYSLVGYDWGASMALEAAAAFCSSSRGSVGSPFRPAAVDALVAFHPTHPTPSEALSRKGCMGEARPLLLWVATDQFHDLKKSGRKLEKALADSKAKDAALVTLATPGKGFNSSQGKGVYSSMAGQVTDATLRHLWPGILDDPPDAGPGAQSAIKGAVAVIAPVKLITTTTGAKVAMLEQITLDWGQGVDLNDSDTASDADGSGSDSDSKDDDDDDNEGGGGGGTRKHTKAPPKIYRPVDVKGEALKEFKALALTAPCGTIDTYFLAVIGKGHAELTQHARKLFGMLPVLPPGAHPDYFVSLGLWSRPRNSGLKGGTGPGGSGGSGGSSGGSSYPIGWTGMDSSPRYFPGREAVAVKAAVNPHPTSDAAYLAMPSGTAAGSAAGGGSQLPAAIHEAKEGAGERFITHRTRILSLLDEQGAPLPPNAPSAPASFVVAVDCEDGGTVPVPVSASEMFKLNQPHLLQGIDAQAFMSGSGGGGGGGGTSAKSKGKDKRTVITLEDGVKCDYSSMLMRAKLCFMAVSIAPIVDQIDFGDTGCNVVPDVSSDSPYRLVSRTTALQQQCVTVIRGVMNITRLQDGVDRSRTTFPDVGKMITYGQGHCHGLSGAMAACLQPFARGLGLDVQYRGGDMLQGTGPPRNNIEHHQWLEVTYRPSMHRTICDLSFLDGRAGKLEGMFGPTVHSDLFLPVQLAYSRTGRTYPNGALIVGARPLPTANTDFAG